MTRMNWGTFKICCLGVWLLGWCGGAFAQEESVLRVSGASTLQPFVERLAEAYQQAAGLPMIVRAGGSGGGIRNTRSGEVEVGMVSRSLRAEEKEDLAYMTVGLDTLVFVVNANNPVQGLGVSDLANLYSGKVDNWQALTGWAEPITLVNKEIGRATLDLFEDYSGLRHPGRGTDGGSNRISANAIEIGSNLEAIMLAGGIPGAIGYVSLGTANALVEQGMPIKIIDLDGVAAEVRHVISGRYPIQRELNLVYVRETPAISILKDIAFSEAGQSIIEELGFIPVN